MNRKQIFLLMLAASIMGAVFNGAPVALIQGQATEEAPPAATAEAPAPLVIDETSPVLEQPQPVGDVTITDGGGAVINTDSPNPLEPLIAFGAPVFAALEILKNLFLTAFLKGLLYTPVMSTEETERADRLYALALWLVAAALAWVGLVVTESTLDVAVLFGYAPASSPGVAFARAVLTAVAVAAPNALIHAGYDWLRKRPVTVVNTRQ